MRLEPAEDRIPAPLQDPETVLSTPSSSPGLPELVRSLLSDAGLLIRSEIELAKMEMQRSASRLARESAFIAAGGFLIALGLLVLLVFIILLLGRLLGGEYWLSTLIVGGILCLAGALVIMKGRRGLRADRLAPTETVASLNETRAWVAKETAEMKSELAATKREQL